MADPTCSICGGTGVRPMPDDDTTVQQCVCAYARALKVHLGPEIAAADLITKSPLLDPGKVDRTKEDLFLVHAPWDTVLSHLKWALGCKGPHFPFRMLTDERLKTVWVGAEDYRNRSRKQRDQMETYNSLGDLVVTGVDLLIIRLGFMGYTNRAMSGVLKETLMLRAAALKPTWIIDNPDNPFMTGHIAYSEDVDNYIHRRFERVVLGTHAPHRASLTFGGIEEATGEVEDGLDSAPPPAPPPSQAAMGGAVGERPKKPAHRPPPRPQPRPEVASTDDEFSPEMAAMMGTGPIGDSPRKKGYKGSKR